MPLSQNRRSKTERSFKFVKQTDNFSLCQGFLVIRQTVSLNETFLYFAEITSGDAEHIHHRHKDQSLRSL